MLTIRSIKESDAEGFLSLCRQLDQETQLMLLEPDERQTTLEEQREHIRAILGSSNQNIFVAENDGQLVGYLAASGGSFRRNRHSAYIVIGILQAFTGRGLGTRLFAELERWAQAHKIHRLELTVMTHNERAIRLYKKAGFEVEGVRKHSLWVNGAYVDEYYMAKLLP